MGVHSAKFDTENRAEGILAAIGRYRISHPVIHDRDHSLWKLFDINSWPSFVLIGSDGQPAGRTSGEGRLQVLDSAISRALDKGRLQGTLNTLPFHMPLKILPVSPLRFPGKIYPDNSPHRHLKGQPGHNRNPGGDRLFVADSGHHRILALELKPESQLQPSGSMQAAVINVIGGGQAGFRDGSFAESEFCDPQGLCLAENHLYIADTGNHALRRADLDLGTVTTLAGNGEQAGWMAQGGPGPATSLNSPWDVLEISNCLYIAMAGSHQLWMQDLQSGYVGPFAGSGREDLRDGPAEMAELAQPSGLCRGGGRIYFADSESSAVRSVSLPDGQIRTLIGAGLFAWGHRDGAWLDARLQHPLGIDFHDDLLYVADTYNHAIRVIDLAAQEIRTVLAPSCGTTCCVDDPAGGILDLFEPGDVKHWKDGLWIADTGNHLVRWLNLKSGVLQTLEIVMEDFS